MNKKFLAAATIATGMLSLVAATAPALASDNTVATNGTTYVNDSGAFLINTAYGSFGPSLAKGDATVTTDASGNVTGETFAAQPIPDGSIGSNISYSNLKVTLAETGVSGQFGSNSATVNAQNLEVDITGSLCLTVSGYKFCDNFMPAAPLQLFITPTPNTKDPVPQSTVTATGNAQPNGSYDLDGEGYVTVSPSTWTGAALGKLINGSSFTLQLNMAPQSSSTIAALPAASGIDARTR